MIFTNFFLNYDEICRKFRNFAPQNIQTEMRTKLHYCSPGGCCWAAFIKDGALRENSPNYIGLHRK